MSVYDTAIKRRSIRRFKDMPVPKDVLEKCVDAARLAPSGANLQPLEYIIVDDEQLVPQVFSIIKWAAYIRPAGDPPPGHEPKAYIAILKEASATAPWTAYDIGGAMDNIMLVALEEGVGSCALLNVDWDKLRTICSVHDSYEISLLIALGYPDESPVEEPFDGSVKYWKDEQGVLHVPKKKLEMVLHWNAF